MSGQAPRIRRLTRGEVAEYDLVPAWAAGRAVLVQVPLLPPAAQGMTMGRFVLLRRPEPTDGTSTLIAHELVHVRQFAERGLVRFLIGYVAAYLTRLVRFRSHRRAYLAIPAEEEAYARSRTWWAARQP